MGPWSLLPTRTASLFGWSRMSLDTWPIFTKADIDVCQVWFALYTKHPVVVTALMTGCRSVRLCTDQVFSNHLFMYFLWLFDPIPSHSHQLRSFTITHTTLGTASLDKWSARRRDFYLTTHNTHKRQISMPPTGFEPTIPESSRPQTYALDRAGTGIGIR